MPATGIQPYVGEFLASPAPLELTLNFCSHKCAYCFANLQSPGRAADIPGIMRFLADFPNRRTLPAQLLQAGYPIVCSNRVDMFAHSNYKATMPILEVMAAQDIPVVFQTKGGRGLDTARRLFPHAVWYVSISFYDDAKRLRIEPAAPSLNERYTLISQIIDGGGVVVVGMNPLVKEWLPPIDRKRLLEHLKLLGVWGVWTEPLHLNDIQFKNLTDPEIEAMGYKVVRRAMHKHPPEVLDYYHDTRRAIREAGMEVFSVGQYEPSQFFQPWRERYPHTFPIQQDFVNWCHVHKQPGDLVTFQDWVNVVGNFPAGRFANMKEYVNQSRKYFTGHIPKDMSYRDLLAIIWQEPRMKRSPQDILCFARATRRGVPLFDDQHLPVLAFNPVGQLDMYMEVA